MLVKEELRECMQLNAQELIDKVYRSAHDTGAMSANWIGDMSDADGIEMLVTIAVLYERLRVQVVQIPMQNDN